MKIFLKLVFKLGLLLFAYGYSVCNAQEVYMGIGYGGLKTQKEYSFTETQDNISLQAGQTISPHFAIEAFVSRSLSSEAPGYYISGTHNDAFWSRLVERNTGMTMDEAHAQYPDPLGWTRMSNDLTRMAAGVFGVYKTTGNPYIKTKAGFTVVKTKSKYRSDSFEGEMVAQDGSVFYGELDKDDADFDYYATRKSWEESNKTTDFSVGFGAGYQLSPEMFAEIEFTRFNTNTEYYSITLNYYY